jgi:hypothetical protein
MSEPDNCIEFGALKYMKRDVEKNIAGAHTQRLAHSARNQTSVIRNTYRHQSAYPAPVCATAAVPPSVQLRDRLVRLARRDFMNPHAVDARESSYTTLTSNQYFYDESKPEPEAAALLNSPHKPRGWSHAVAPRGAPYGRNTFKEPMNSLQRTDYRHGQKVRRSSVFIGHVALPDVSDNHRAALADAAGKNRNQQETHHAALHMMELDNIQQSESARRVWSARGQRGKMGKIVDDPDEHKMATNGRLNRSAVSTSNYTQRRPMTAASQTRRS